MSESVGLPSQAPVALYKWWLGLAAFYAAFIGLTALQFSVDSELAAGSLSFWPWFGNFTRFPTGLGFFPFTVVLMATWFTVCVSGLRVYNLFSPAPAGPRRAG